MQQGTITIRVNLIILHLISHSQALENRGESNESRLSHAAHIGS